MPAVNATNTSAHFWRVSSKKILLWEGIWLSITGAGKERVRNLWPHDHKADLFPARDKSCATDCSLSYRKIRSNRSNSETPDTLPQWVRFSAFLKPAGCRKRRPGI